MPVTLDLGGKTALVTGASRGIGRATAEALARAGASVALAARSADDLHAVAAGLGAPVHVFPVDLVDPAAADVLAAQVLERTGGVDILVNNAGVSVPQRSEDSDGATVAQTLRVNLESALRLTIALAPAMFERGGAVVNVSSMAGVVGVPGHAAYAASKGGLDAVTRALACEWGPRGIRVNSVAPGLIVTDMWQRGRQRPEVVQTLERHVSLRRWGLPEDVAKVVLFLVSDLAGYVTGETLVVDGGLARMFDALRG